MNMSVIIKSHRRQVAQVKQNRSCMNVFMYMRMCLCINSKIFFLHSVMQICTALVIKFECELQMQNSFTQK